jgi:PPOX class probable F420-dependent enzyme
MHHRPVASPLSPDERAFLAAARTATLATIAPDGAPRLVPVCFVVGEAEGDLVVYTPLDEKPKRSWDVRSLARVRDIVDRPEVALLVHQWSEDWSELGWLRLGGTGTLFEPGDDAGRHAGAVAALREKYPQYAEHRLEGRPLIRIEITASRAWGDLGQRLR